MTETTQQTVKSGEKRLVRSTNDVVIEGLELVGDKIGGIIQQILMLDKEADNFGVRTIIFRNDGYPKNALGKSYPLAGAIAINLQEVWDMCVEDFQKKSNWLSLSGHLWNQLLLTILHEIHHVDACRDPEMIELIENSKKDLDDEAEAWAQEVIDDLAKEFDIEPIALAEMEFFGLKLMDLVTKMQSADNQADFGWLDRALTMLEDGVIYHDPDNDILIKTYREYRRGIKDPEGKDNSWGKAISVIDLVVDGKPIADEELVAQDSPEAEKEPDVVVLTPGYDQSIAQDEAEEAIVEKQMAMAAAAPGEEGSELVADDQATTLAPEDIDDSNVVEAAVPMFAVDVPNAAPITAPATPATPTQTPLFASSVPLAPHIQQQNTFMANAAAGPAPQAPARPQQYEVNNVDPEKFKKFMKDVYMRLYTQIFTKCGWQLQSDQGFLNPGNIVAPVDITDLEKTHGVKNVIMEYMTVNAQGQPITEKCQGHVRGTVFTKSNPYGLPAFVLFLNFNGMQLKRSLVPQNPAKRGTDGQYKATALEARSGHPIAWVMADGQNAWKGKIKDNVYEELN